MTKRETEYMRRNALLAKTIGASNIAKRLRTSMNSRKRKNVVDMAELLAIVERLEPVQTELLAHRDEVK